jgi:hypothetical protein
MTTNKPTFIQRIVYTGIVIIVGTSVLREMERQGLIKISPSEMIFNLILPWRWFK